jgi:Fe-S cluster assembly ATPase SufC
VDPENGKLEWPNWNESDYTPDNSHLTSVLTDGLIETETDDRVNPPVALVMQGNPNDISGIQTSPLLSVDYDDDEEDNSDLDVNDYVPGYDGEDGQDGSDSED